MAFLAVFGPFGWFLPALLAWMVLAWDSGWLLFPTETRRMRWLGGLTAAFALSVALLQVLFYAGGLTPAVLFVGLVVTVGLGRFLRRVRRHQEQRPPPLPWSELVAALPACGVALVALGATLISAYWLPIWQWDSLGYHLPFVNFVLQDGGLRGLPVDVGYLSTYPRNVELLFVAMRATLPDDRLIDVGQIPFGLTAAFATAAIARELGATRAASLIAGAAVLTLPAVFLQLPTNYVDVGSAAFFLLAVYFLIAPPTTTSLVLAGLSIGLFLGTKPNAPPSAALLGVVLLVRAKLSNRLKLGAVGLLLAGALGTEAYLAQLIRHGNPVWPAIVKIGPWELPGTISVTELLSSGAGAQKVYGSMPVRIFSSWTNLSSLPTFDMRVGGLGQVFWLAAPLALVGLVRRRSVLLVAVVGISVVAADPAVVRYIFQFPALVLALAAAEVCHWLTRASLLARTRLLLGRVVGGAVAVLPAACGVYQLCYAFPGLTGEGPPLFHYAHLTWAEREWAVGANGRPTSFVEARQKLAPGELAVYDRALWLPYLMWRSDAANRVARIPDGADRETVSALLDRPDARLIAVGHDQPARPVILERSEYRALFECREPCTVYLKE
jgi:hypothetical protein